MAAALHATVGCCFYSIFFYHYVAMKAVSHVKVVACCVADCVIGEPKLATVRLRFFFD